jgi:hypothetical protein
MKNFLKHLIEVQKTYDFRIKIANIDPKESMARLKDALNAYGLESLSDAKTLPIVENHVDFPAFKAPEVYVMDAVLKYPVNEAQLRALIADRAGLPQSSIRVTPRNQPEELWRNNEGELREYVQGESVLDKPYEDNPEGKAAGKAYAEAGSLLKELAEVKIEIEGKDTTIGGDKDPSYGKTTNDVPTGDKSPVGSNKNKIPSPK